MNEKIIGLIGYVLMADSRKKIMEVLLGKYATPFGLATTCDMSISLSNMTLKSLKEKGLVKCIDYSSKRHKIYCLTDMGAEVSRNLEEYSKLMILE